MNIVFMESLGMDEKAVRNACRTLEGMGHRVRFYAERSEDEAELIKRAENAEVIVISNVPLHKSFFDACPALKMISVAFTGVDHIDLNACREKNITVCNAAGYSTRAVAELSIGLMIAVYRKIVEGDKDVRAGGVRRFLGTELGGKTVGIIGMGAIGQAVARLVQAFDCKVIAYNRSPKEVAGVEFVDKQTLFKKADIVTVHIPLTPATRGFVSTAEFALMQPHAILINTARGPVVDEDALFEALRNNQIAGAGIDVYGQEPPLPAGFELFDAPNLVILPHEGFATCESFAARLGIVVNNIEKWLAGTPQNKVD